MRILLRYSLLAAAVLGFVGDVTGRAVPDDVKCKETSLKVFGSQH
jgi:hypothetical protein